MLVPAYNRDIGVFPCPFRSGYGPFAASLVITGVGSVMDSMDDAVRAAQLLSEPLRMRVIALLGEGPATVSGLTARLGASQPRISAHLAVLREAGWVQLSARGQQRWYRLASAEVVAAIATLAALTQRLALHERPVRPRSRTSAVEALQDGRTCYRHLAGRAGVQICDALRTKGWIIPVENKAGKYQPAFALTEAGREGLLARGVALPAVSPRRQLAYACPDWTESGPHLGGALGDAILRRLEQEQLVRRLPATRAVAIEGDLARWFD